MMNIVIANRQRVKKINSRLLKEIVSAILTDLTIEHCELEINLIGAGGMAALNETFLRHEGSTDVITFDYSVGPVSSLSHFNSEKIKDRQDAFPTLHGEIFVCVDEAILQAKQFKTTWQSEIIRYVVHGILHLLGHDDLSSRPKRKMKRKENRLVHQLSRRFALSKL